MADYTKDQYYNSGHFSDQWKWLQNYLGGGGTGLKDIGSLMPQLQQIGAAQGLTPEDFAKSSDYYQNHFQPYTPDATGYWGPQTQLRTILNNVYDVTGKNINPEQYLNRSVEAQQQKAYADQQKAEADQHHSSGLGGLGAIAALAALGFGGAGLLGLLGEGAAGLGAGAGFGELSSAAFGGQAAIDAAVAAGAAGGVGVGSGGSMFDWGDPSTWGDVFGSGGNAASGASDSMTQFLQQYGGGGADFGELSAPIGQAGAGSASNTASLWQQISNLPSGLQNIAKGLMQSGNTSALGALLGGVLGSVNGSKQAGTTTSTQTSDFPSWYLPFAQGLVQNAGNTFGNQGAPDMSLVNAARAQQLKTVNGDYLNPETNPYLKKSVEDSMGLAAAGANSQFSAAGRYGSGAHADALGTSLGRISNNAYMNNYTQERGNQVNAANNAPAWFNSAATAPYANINAYGGALNQVKPGATTTSQVPYYTNTTGNILSGALAGSQFGKMWGQ